MTNDLALLLATSAVLVSWWKALLFLPPFVAWAWLISAKLDKDARFYHLNHEMWNGIQMAAGLSALAAGLFIPIFWVSWPIMVIILTLPVLAYWYIRNRNVPEEERFALTGQSLSERLETRRQSKASRAAVLQFMAPDGEPIQVPGRDDPKFATHMLTEDLISPAVAGRASRIDMVLAANGCRVSQVVDGVAFKRDGVPTESSVQLFDYLKTAAGLDPEDKRRKQISEFTMTGPAGKTALALTTWGSSSAQNMRIEFDRAKRLVKPFDALGLLPTQLEGLRELEPPHELHGIILIGAPPGHGLTTSAFSFISRHDAYTANVKALEREIKLELEGVDHILWDTSDPDVDYATALQSILRRDPDIVLVDILKNPETAKIAAEPGMRGPLIYIQLPLPSIAEVIRNWVKLVGDVSKAIKPLRAVTNQRLLRSLCPNCRQPFPPTPEQLKKLNIASGKVEQLFRASGKVQVKNKIEPCQVCGGSGYLGQTAAFEVMLLDDDTRKILASGDLKAAMAHARRNKMVYLQEAALSKVVRGETTIEEVIRVTAPSKNDGPPPTPRPVATA